jgi:hypothetical protein
MSRAGELRIGATNTHPAVAGRSIASEIRLFSAIFGEIDRFATISAENGLASDFELLL